MRLSECEVKSLCSVDVEVSGVLRFWILDLPIPSSPMSLLRVFVWFLLRIYRYM